MGKYGIQFAFKVEDRPGLIRELIHIIRLYGGRMVSILSTYENIREEYRKVSIHTYGVERDQLPQLEKELGEKPNTATWWTFENTTGRFFEFRRTRILFEKNNNDDASAVMVPSEKMFRQR